MWQSSQARSFSLIVASYNRLGLLQKCLVDILRTLPAGQPHEILVVDDGSTDRTREWLGEHAQSSSVRAILREMHSGYAVANNEASRASSGDILAFLNADLELQPGWLEPMLDLATAWARDWEERIAIEPRPVRTNTTPQESASIFRKLFGRSRLESQAVADGRPPGPARILVDLAPLAPDGASEGIKRLVRELLDRMRHLAPGRFRFQLVLPLAMRSEALLFAGPDDEIWFLPDEEAGHTRESVGRGKVLTIADTSLARSPQSDLIFFPSGVSDFCLPLSAAL